MFSEPTSSDRPDIGLILQAGPGKCPVEDLQIKTENEKWADRAGDTKTTEGILKNNLAETRECNEEDQSYGGEPRRKKRHCMAPVDDVMAWGESFDHLLECKTGQLAFEDFLRTEYSEENLLFWLACEDYKRITSGREMTSTAKKIYTEFVQVDAPRQINIDCVTREEISEKISQPGPNCFNRAQKLIYGLMENDCYPRFLKSEIYQALLEEAEQQ